MDIQPYFLTEDEIHELIEGPLSDEEIAECKANHLLVPVLDDIFEGTTGPSSMYFTTRSGKTILDCTSQAWSLAFGHGNPDVTYALALQALKANHVRYGFLTPVRVKLCNKLAAIAPGELQGGRIALNNLGGGGAVECAIRLALTNRKRGDQIVTFWRGYHGSSLALAGASQQLGLAMRYRPFGVDRWIKAPFPYCYRCPWGYTEGLNGCRDKSCSLECVEFLRQQIDYFTTSGAVACLIEPIQGPGGQIPAPWEFLAGLKQICKASKIMLIYDESQTGFGRTGHMWATEWYTEQAGQDLSSDVIAATKAAAGGYPLGITIAKSKVKGLSEAEEHSTFSSNPAIMAAALASIAILEKHHLPENATRMGELLTKGLRDLQAEFPVIGDIRGPGLFIGVEMVRDPDTREPFTPLIEHLTKNAWDEGLALGEMMPIIKESGELIRNVLKIKPPLVINEEHVQKVLEILENALKKSLDELT
jgi:4-aminobutyrate aminotransferase-like enzyme